MLKNLQLDNVLFLDIETVPMVHDYSNLPDDWKSLWEKKAARIKKEDETIDESFNRAGIYAEFGKIVCISVGIIKSSGKHKTLRLKSFYGDDEKILLFEFNEMLERYFDGDQYFLCAHNGKEFDFPYIARRTLINGLSLPNILDLAGKKPWEVRHLDTLELWKFGDYKHYTPLNLLTKVFDIPSPKDDIDGSDVARVYYEEQDLERIAVYCQKDVLAVVQLLLRYKGEGLISEDNIEISDK
ncbi:MAG: 3'-5' exonuclease [Marinilabiliales bacterium]|nr:MAG: 3'-5' exonuclease [Marinilabiliales bacterium]